MFQYVSDKYDMIVIGSGPAGENAAELASYFGYRVAIIERNKPGGTPTTHGGAPTKTLREAALVLTGFYDQEVYGVELGAPPAVALDKLAQRTRQVCLSLQTATARRIALMDVAYLHGTARLAPGGKVLLTKADGAVVELSAGIILIATGSRPLRPKNIPFKETWGERVRPAHSINLLALFALLPIIVLLATPTLRQGVAEDDASLIQLGLSVMLIAISSYTQLSALVNAIFTPAAYRYATARKGDVFPGDPTYAEHAPDLRRGVAESGD